jgi:hypothetical protein
MRTALALAFAALLAPSLAFADVVPSPDDCEKMQEGEACKDYAQKPGACGTLTDTAYNHATDPPTPRTRSYFGCVTGKEPTVKPPTVSSKSCDMGSVGAAERGAGAATGAALALAVLLARRTRRA